MPASPTIRPLGSADLSAFFAYLNAHLQDNGRDGAPLFQPMSRAHPVFPADKIIAFTKGLSLAVGAPGWRRAWIATDEGGIVGHVDLRARPDTRRIARCWAWACGATAGAWGWDGRYWRPRGIGPPCSPGWTGSTWRCCRPIRRHWACTATAVLSRPAKSPTCSASTANGWTMSSWPGACIRWSRTRIRMVVLLI